ncbi:MAG: hypothetical protein IJ033_00015 [Clostridia bacterium]|nr:hypothetical protein [Clostridia bacterium]
MKNDYTFEKRLFAVILTLIFIVINLLHIYWPIHLIMEDIRNATMVGTGIEMGVLYPWMTEVLSIPFVLGQILYYVLFRRYKPLSKFNVATFTFYLLQVVLFNALLWF